MKKILLLESNPEINRNYLWYLQDAWYELLWTSDDFCDNEIFGLIFRSKIIIDKELLAKYKNIKFIFRIGTWLDNVNLDLCKQKWIKVFNSHGANADSVADLAVWWSLSLMRKIKNIWNITKDRFNYIWHELWNKNICMVWFGYIGKKIYQRLVWFGVNNFLIIDPFLSGYEVEKYMGCEKYKNIDEIWNRIDILYISLPLNKETSWYINEKLLNKLRKNVTIINVARWWLINVKDLYKFLEINKESWAYIDSDIDGNMEKLNKLDNCIVSPHIGAMTQEANYKMHQFNVKNILNL